MVCSCMTCVMADEAALRVLQIDHGLTSIGQLWITADEVELRRRMTRVPKLYQEIVAGERAIQNAITSNAVAHRRLLRAKQLLEQVETSRDNSAEDSSQRKRLDEQVRLQEELVRALSEQCTTPENLGRLSAVKNTVVAFINARAELAVSMHWIRRHIAGLDASYEVLQANPGIQQALRNLGAQYNLGPAGDYHSDVGKFERYERVVYSEFLPMYVDDDRYRVGVMLGDETPATFTIGDSGAQTWIPQSLIESAGLSVPADAPHTSIQIDSNRQVVAQQFTVPYLRIGRFVLTDVEALALPSEDADLGAQIGPNGFSGYRVEVLPKQLRLQLTSN